MHSCVRLRFASWALFMPLTVGLALAQSGPGPEQDQATNSAGNQDATIRVDVDLVNLFYTVREKKGGQIIPNLAQSDFKVFENGKEEKIQRFSKESDLPLTLGLLIDISASQERLIDIERQAASQFFSSVIRKKDEAFLISFGKSTDLLQDYTSSPKLLTSALEDLRGDGGGVMTGGPIPNSGPVPTIGSPRGTLLYDAVYLASNDKLKPEVGRKALVLITDGEDQGSTYKLSEAIEAAQRSDAIVYSIYYVDHYFYAGRGMVFGSGGKGELEKMSGATGGRVFEVNSKHTLSDIFEEIQNELRNQYSIGYSPSNGTRDGTFRKIEIKVDRNDARVQARAGYYATKNDAQ
jgi:VWFA-related protein